MLLTQASLPEIDLTISISVIVALAAIISPILTTLINNHHQMKIRKLELKQQEYKDTIIHKRDLFENYLKYAGRCVYCADPTALKDYGEYYFSALTYAPDDLKSDMIEANQFMVGYKWDEALVLIEKLSTKIHAILHTK